MADLITTILPILKIVAIVFVGGGAVIGAGYYFFIVKRRKKWFINLYEQKSDGRLHLLGQDKLVEKKFDRGRRTFYWMSKCKVEVTPPPWEAVDRVGNKDYAAYIRIRQSYVPMVKKAPAGVNLANPFDPEVKRTSGLIQRATKAIKKSPKYKKVQDIEDRFVYAPINKVPHIDIGYHQMEYDVDMMRMNQIDNIDKMFSMHQSFLEKYGTLIAAGIIIVGLIVVAYLSFEYMTGVIEQSYGHASQMATALDNVASKLGASVPTGGGTPLE